jgi:hypothetical protein
MDDIKNKVLKLVNSTNEMIELSLKSIELYNRLNIAVIKEKLLKDVKNKIVQPKELSDNVKKLLLENKVDVTKFSSLYRRDNIIVYDNGIIELRTYVKNTDTIVYVIDDQVLFCPV